MGFSFTSFAAPWRRSRTAAVPPSPGAVDLRDRSLPPALIDERRSWWRQLQLPRISRKASASPPPAPRIGPGRSDQTSGQDRNIAHHDRIARDPTRLARVRHGFETTIIMRSGLATFEDTLLDVALALNRKPDATHHGIRSAIGVLPGFRATFERLAATPTRAWIDDLVQQIDRTTADGSRVVLTSFSAGALTSLAAAAERPGKVCGVVLIAPPFRLASKSLARLLRGMYAIASKLPRGAQHLLRHIPVPVPVDSSKPTLDSKPPRGLEGFSSLASVVWRHITRRWRSENEDTTVAEERHQQRFAHWVTIPLGAAFNLLELQRQSRDNLQKLGCPLVIAQGTDDKLADPQTTERFFAEAPTPHKRLLMLRAGHNISESAERVRHLEALQAAVHELADLSRERHLMARALFQRMQQQSEANPS